MLTFLYVLQFIIAFLLIFFIFLQKREETTSLLSSNNYNSMFKGMSVPSNPLIKITLIIGVLFFINSILISAVLLKKSKASSSLIKKVEDYKKDHSIPTTGYTDSSLKNNKDTIRNKTKSLPAVPLGNY